MALAVPLAGLTYLAVENVKVFHPRYAAVAAPMFLVVWAAALADLRPRLRAGALAAVGALWIVALGHHYFDPRYGKEDRPQGVLPKLSQELLAEMIGTTRSRVNFFMNKFRKLGFIKYNGGLRINTFLLSVVLHDNPE